MLKVGTKVILINNHNCCVATGSVGLITNCDGKPNFVTIKFDGYNLEQDAHIKNIKEATNE